MKNICVECKKELSASEVKDALPLNVSGSIMKSIIWVKRKTNTYNGNKLYVCKNEVKSYMKNRNGFLKSQYLLFIIFGFLALLVIVLPLFSGIFSLDSFILLILLFGVLYVLILLRGYYPPLIGYKPEIEKGGAKDKGSNKPKDSSKTNDSSKLKKFKNDKNTVVINKTSVKSSAVISNTKITNTKIKRKVGVKRKKMKKDTKKTKKNSKSKSSSRKRSNRGSAGKSVKKR